MKLKIPPKFTVIASIFTFLNMICGTIGIFTIINLSEEYRYLPLQLLIIGAIFDFLDGKFAKMAPTQTSMGIYLDSIGDTITFAVLPGFMVINAIEGTVRFVDININTLLVLIVGLFYSLGGWLRLVRFSFHPTGFDFEGLPSPAAALLVGSAATMATFTEMNWLFWDNGIPLSIITTIIAFLMITTIHYPSPKRMMSSDNVLIGVAGLLVILYVIYPALITLIPIFLISVLYTVMGPVYLKKTSKITN